MSNFADVSIQITGGAQAGKGSVAAYITKVLRDAGATVTLQGEETFNKAKVDADATALRVRLSACRVLITEQQTT